MATNRITKRSVDAFVCPEGKDRDFLWDDSLSGFGLVAFASGKKTFIAQFRKDGRSRRITVGDHGRLTPDEARSEAKKLLGAVEKGSDPIEERKQRRAVRTFKEVATEFLALHVKPKRRATTHAEYQRLLNLHVFPAIGSKRIVNVHKSEVARLHAKMIEKPIIANKALAVISSAWNWAASRDEVLAIANPAIGIERYEEKKHERFLTGEEMMRLGDPLREAETIGLEWTIDEAKKKAKHAPKPENRRVVIDPYAVAAMRLLLLTGARLREILDLKWSQVDVERGMAFLPTSKTGCKPLYLSAATQLILANLPRIDGNPHVIAGRTSTGPRSDLKRPWDNVRRAAKILDVRLHDLRHSFASLGVGGGMGLPIIGKLLGHSQPATTARYAHLDADPMHRAANSIGDTIIAAMNGGKPENVVYIDKRR